MVFFIDFNFSCFIVKQTEIVVFVMCSLYIVFLYFYFEYYHKIEDQNNEKIR